MPASPVTVPPTPALRKSATPRLDRALLARALRKLRPAALWRNRVLLAAVGAATVATVTGLRHVVAGAPGTLFALSVAFWLWTAVLACVIAEALAEAGVTLQADALRRNRGDAIARRITNGRVEPVPATRLKAGDVVLCEAGDLIPGDGEVIEGIATVDESVITGESAPVIRESGGDRAAVNAGTRVLSDFLHVRITSGQGETFLDQMLALVEMADRQPTPREARQTQRLEGVTLLAFLAAAFLMLGQPARWSVTQATALFASLLPLAAGGLLAATGIAALGRVMRHHVLVQSGKAIEAAGEADTLLIDKTGTVTVGNREAIEFVPLPGVPLAELVEAAYLASIGDETPEGHSVAALARQRHGARGVAAGRDILHVPFSAYTRMSGADLGNRRVRKGATEAVSAFVAALGGHVPPELRALSDRISRSGGTPLAVADGPRALGVIHLKDAVKGGLAARVASLRAMGIRTVMITGDNPLTAEAIAREAGTDDFIAQATPKDKLEFIKREQASGRRVAMTGDGSNDAPALAQADVGLAMNTGTPAAKEAGNTVDLDSNPTKLLELSTVGRQLLLSRDALAAFSVASSVAKALILAPLLLAGTAAPMTTWNVLGLRGASSALLAATMFSSLATIALLPIALNGVRCPPRPAAALRREVLVAFGAGGFFAPFAGVWLLEWLLRALGLP